jgi:hypothetical protein
MFIPLRKVDAAQRLVYGFIDETPDRSREVFDYESSKAHFQTWSDGLAKATDGKSLGNVRSMHQAVAAGKLTQLDFDDVNKRVELCAHIVDDAEWEKVEQGVYTGFSPGGKYLKRWKDGENTRYTARPSEMSLVDLPCIPSAAFTLVKADGLTEQRSFQTLKGDDLRKSLYQVSRMADLLDNLTSLGQSAAWEAATEKDGSPVPGQIRDWLTTGVAIFTAMATEESSEAVAALAAVVQEIPDAASVMALAAKTEDLAKAGARNSATDKKHLQTIHDHAVSMGADCSSNSEKAAGAGDDLAKMADSMAKLTNDLGTANDSLVKVTLERDDLVKRVADLEAEPTQGGPRLRAVGKGDDIGDDLAKRQIGDDGEGTFDERLAKINPMPAGPEKAKALLKLAKDFPNTSSNA